METIFTFCSFRPSSISTATKCIPYTVVFGRDPVLPEDVLLGIDKRYEYHDVNNASDYAEELKGTLNKICKQVNVQLEITRTNMQRQYNKRLNVQLEITRTNMQRQYNKRLNVQLEITRTNMQRQYNKRLNVQLEITRTNMQRQYNKRLNVQLVKPMSNDSIIRD